MALNVFVHVALLVLNLYNTRANYVIHPCIHPGFWLDVLTLWWQLSGIRPSTCAHHVVCLESGQLEASLSRAA